MGAKAITIRKYDSNIPLMTLRKSDAMTSAFHIAVPRYEGGV